MSFFKAQDLIRLAQLAVARRVGISLEEIASEFAVSHRTAQRMADALVDTFGNVSEDDGQVRKRRAYNLPASLEASETCRSHPRSCWCRSIRSKFRISAQRLRAHAGRSGRAGDRLEADLHATDNCLGERDAGEGAWWEGLFLWGVDR